MFKKILLSLVILIFITALTSFTGKQNTNQDDKSPRIVFSEEKHDFGKVPQGPQLIYNFRFKNKGSGTLTIGEIATSCGCTGANVGEQKDYEKNETGQIQVTFNTQGREGHQEKTILVKSNDPANPTKALQIMCDIDPGMDSGN